MSCQPVFANDLALTNFFTQRMSTCQLRTGTLAARTATIEELVVCPNAPSGTILTVDDTTGAVDCFEPAGATPGDMLTYTGSGLTWTSPSAINPCTALNNLTVGTGGGTACLPPGAAGEVLTVVAGAPTWSALPPGPCTALNNLTVGTGGGTACLPPGAAGEVLTVVAGAPTWSALPPGPCTALNNLTVGTGGATACLPPGAAGEVLTVVAGAPTWSALPPGPCTALNNLTVGTGGGTACLPPGAAGEVLTVVAGAPTWASSGVCTALNNLTVGAGGGGTSCLLPPASNDSILRYDGVNVNWFLRGVAPSQSLLNLSGTSLNWFSPGASGSVLRTIAGPTLDWLPPGLTNQVLSVVGGVPVWQHPVLNTVQARANASTILPPAGANITFTAGTLLPVANPDYTFPAGTTLTINTTGTYLFQATIPFVRTSGPSTTAMALFNFFNVTTATGLDPIVPSFTQTGGAANSISSRATCTLVARVAVVAGQQFAVRGFSTVGTFSAVPIAPAPATTAIWTVTRVG
jgi:hypothetical protein